MTDKNAYISYKNNELIPFISLKLKESKIKIEEPSQGCRNLIKMYPPFLPPRPTLQIQIPIVIRPVVKQ